LETDKEKEKWGEEVMGTKKGQQRKTARRAYVKKKGKGPRTPWARAFAGWPGIWGLSKQEGTQLTYTERSFKGFNEVGGWNIRRKK